MQVAFSFVRLQSSLLQSCCTANITTKPNYLLLLLSLYSCVVLCVFEKCTLKSFRFRIYLRFFVFFIRCPLSFILYPMLYTFLMEHFSFSFSDMCFDFALCVCVCVCLFHLFYLLPLPLVCMFVNTFALLFISFNSFCI